MTTVLLKMVMGKNVVILFCKFAHLVTKIKFLTARNKSCDLIAIYSRVEQM